MTQRNTNRKQNNRKILRFRGHPFHINIGILLFALVLIYFVVNILSYSFRSHVAGYEVQAGQIADTAAYTGLILRTEKLVNSTASGSLNYYKKEGDNVAVRDRICSIDKDGSLSSKITAAGKDISKLSDEDLDSIQTSIAAFSADYTSDSFYKVYNFKNSINSALQEDLYLSALKNYSDETSKAVSNRTFTFLRAADTGILALYSDGYESVTPENFKASDYSPANYKKTDFKEQTTVKTGSPIYKLATSENWYIMVPITAAEKKTYADRSVLKVTFLQDSSSCYASSKVISSDGKYFLRLGFNSSMVRYISDRYIDISIVLDSSSGLKIPNSAVTSKEFFVIPKDYLTKGNDSSSSQGVLRHSSGSDTPEFTPVDIYNETSKYYYIKEDSLEAGDTIQMPNSTKQYTISKTASLKGVYNINKGYAVFKVVKTLSSNDEYSIVASGTDYGISLYDHIALNADQVSENQVIS
jgi:hypothetical protein